MMEKAPKAGQQQPSGKGRNYLYQSSILEEQQTPHSISILIEYYFNNSRQRDEKKTTKKQKQNGFVSFQRMIILAQPTNSSTEPSRGFREYFRDLFSHQPFPCTLHHQQLDHCSWQNFQLDPLLVIVSNFPFEQLGSHCNYFNAPQTHHCDVH